MHADEVQYAKLLQAFYRQIEASAERWNESDICRIEGDLRLAQNESESAERCYRQAIEIPGAQQARSFELRATTALARLWAERGERQKAQDLISPLYGWFTEGLDTTDLKETKSLLEELS